MKLAFTTLGCPDWTLRQVVENAAHMGYDAIDFRGLLADVDITQRPEFTTDLAATKRLIADHGLVVSGLAASARYAVVDPAEKQKHFDETRRYLALARELDTNVVRIFGGRAPTGYTPETVLPYLVANFCEMAGEADAHDVTLALETHDDWLDSALVRRAMVEANHPRVRVIWDLHHPYRFAGESPEYTFGNLAPYIVAIHVKDSRPGGADLDAKNLERFPQGVSYVLTGQGDVPLKRMLDLLVGYGFDGYAILEWEKRWHPEMLAPEVAFPQYVEQMRAWLG